MTNDQRAAMIRAMRIYGGSFAAAIAQSYELADSNNAARLDGAFPDFVARYGPGGPFDQPDDQSDDGEARLRLMEGGL